MDDKLLKKYLKYANTDEALAVLFVKKHLADQVKSHWIDIADCERYEMSSDNLHFRFVAGGLYKRKIHPKYPSKSTYTINGKFDESGYRLMVRALTWETARTDIDQQKLNKVIAQKIKITGVSYLQKRSADNFFRVDAPAEIKALANDLLDRTNPLWDRAMEYINESEYVYEIRQVRIT